MKAGWEQFQQRCQKFEGGEVLLNVFLLDLRHAHQAVQLTRGGKQSVQRKVLRSMGRQQAPDAIRRQALCTTTTPAASPNRGTQACGRFYRAIKHANIVPELELQQYLQYKLASSVRRIVFLLHVLWRESLRTDLPCRMHKHKMSQRLDHC